MGAEVGLGGGSQCLLPPLPQDANYTNAQDTNQAPPHPPPLTAAAVAVAFQLHALSPRGLRGLGTPWPGPPDCPKEQDGGPGERDEEGSLQEGSWEGPPVAEGKVERKAAGGGGEELSGQG